MQKRRGGTTAADQGSGVLPMTTQDTGRNSRQQGGSSSSKKRKRSMQSAIVGVLKTLLVIVGIGLFVVVVQKQLVRRKLEGAGGAVSVEDTTTKAFRYVTDGDEDQTGPLAMFESLQYPLHNSKIVALYFAAAWCPDSAPITELLEETFEDILEGDDDDDDDDDDTSTSKEEGKREEREKHRKIAKHQHQRPLSLVYVSSDETLEEMEDYMRPNWMAVPFDSPEKQELKIQFETCAKKEVHALGSKMKRKRGIPTLVIIAGNTQQVLTYAGVDDVKQDGVDAVHKWMELAQAQAQASGRCCG